MTAPEPYDLGRFEPTPYDIGITDDPEATWADVQLAPDLEHDCPGPECHPYPTFDDDPARWGFPPEPEMAEAEVAAAAEAEAWGGREPSASYAEWVAEGRPTPEPELEP